MLISFIFVSIFALSYGAPSLSNHDEISKYIFGLNYDPDAVLVYRGKQILSPGHGDGHVDTSGNYIFLSREKKNISTSNLNLGFIDLNDHRIYPGVLLKANDHLLDQRPDIISLQRAPMRYTVDLPGLTKNDSVFDIVPVYSEYKGSLEETKKTWFVSYPDDHVIPAKFKVDKGLAHSLEQLKVKFGLSVDIIKSGVDFEAVHKNEKVVYVYKFIQNFYKVSIDYPTNSANVFAPEVSLNQVMQWFDEKSPPILVDSITYGRIIYVTIETTSNENEAKGALSSQFSKFTGSVNVDANYNFDNLDMKVFIYGGSPDQIDILKAKSFADVDTIITRYAHFSRNNPGVPIFYTTAFLKDNSVATASGFTDYTDIERIVTKHGTIGLENYNSYATKWYLDWDEVNIESTGAETVQHKVWDESGDWKYFGFTKYVNIPGNAKNIHFKVEYWAGMNGWVTLTELFNVPLVAKGRSIKVQNGDTPVLNPEVIINPHDDLHLGRAKMLTRKNDNRNNIQRFFANPKRS